MSPKGIAVDLDLGSFDITFFTLLQALHSYSQGGRSSPRPISTGPLNALRRLHARPINRVVYSGAYLVNPVGGLILRWASRLDAFSAYPVRT